MHVFLLTWLKPAVSSPLVTVIPPTATATAGSPLLLTCSIILASELIQGTVLVVMWTLANGATIMAGERLSGYTSLLVNKSLSFSSFLIISSLLPFDGGIYNCTVHVNSTVLYVLSSSFESSISQLIVQGKIDRKH